VGIELPEARLAVRGRLSLYLGDIPRKWPGEFLTQDITDEELIRTMRDSYFDAGPGFQARNMAPRPIKISAFLTGAVATWDALERQPVIRKIVIGLVLVTLLLGLLVVLW
jgi:hypothetical protein